MKFIKHPLWLLKEWFKAVFTYPTSTLYVDESEDYDVYWEAKRGKNIGSLSSWQKERAEFILRFLKNNKGASVSIADIGCADGSVLLYIKEALQNTGKLIGYDSSRFALEVAQKQGVQTHHLNIGTKENLSILEKADYYLMLEIVEHIPHSEQLIFEALHKSEKGVFVSFPNTGYYRHRLRLLFGKFPLQWRVFPNEHVRFWTRADVKWWLKSLGIKEYKLHCYKGIPVLNKIFPSLFGAGIILHIQK